MLISKIVYLALITSVPTEIISKLKKIHKKFIWSSNNPKIKHTTLSNNYKSGGLKRRLYDTSSKGVPSGVCVCVCVCVWGEGEERGVTPPPPPTFLESVGILTKCVGKIFWSDPMLSVNWEYFIIKNEMQNSINIQSRRNQTFADDDDF